MLTPEVDAAVTAVMPSVEDIKEAVDNDIDIMFLLAETLKPVPDALRPAFAAQLFHIARVSFMKGTRYGSKVAFDCLKAARKAQGAQL